VRVRGDELPAALAVTDAGQVADKKQDGSLEPFHAGRLTYDAASHTLHVQGVLPDTEASRLIEETAPAAFREKVERLEKQSQEINGEGVKSASVRLTQEPPGFDLKYAGLKKSVLRYDASARTLTALQPLADKDVKALLVAGGDPGFRATVHELMVESSK